MEKLLKYSVLRYSPSIISGERINLGILFSEESIGFHMFRYTARLSRVRNFDDEVDLKSLRALLRGIAKEVEGSNQDFDISAYIKYYINDFAFEKPNTIIYEDLDKTVNDLYGAYFRFDLAPDERPSKNADRDILSRLIMSTGKNIYKKEFKGIYDEKISYDIVTDDYCVKLFDLDKKDLKRYINSAKLWAWNSDHEKNKQVLIVYRYGDDELAKEDFDIIKKIFDESKGHFCSLEESMQLLSKAG